jgi:cellulose synthase operon protein C
MSENRARKSSRHQCRLAYVRSLGRATLVSLALVCACTGVTPNETHPVAVRRAPPAPRTSPTHRGSNDVPPLDLAAALAAVANGRYQVAEPALLRIIEHQPDLSLRAQVALSEVELMTGRGERALDRMRPHCRAQDVLLPQACSIAAEVLRRQGNLEQAASLLAASSDRTLQLALADILSDRGRITEARALWRHLVDDYAQARIAADDARELTITGRAAHRLGAWREANELFNRAEMTGITELSMLLWRGELYLDAHDPIRAHALADEALRFAPDHPSALLLAARVRLSESQDGEQAEQYVRRALAIDPARSDAYAILAGLALRDLDFERVQVYLDQGLAKEPRHLELLCLRAAARFLADDQPGFEAAVFDVLQRNPSHARVYRLVAEYAEAEHRYDDTIPLLRRAIDLDPDDSSVRAQLGIQLLRSGDEAEGRKQLAQAFRRDPFDWRVRNTLVLYERKIDKQYSLIRHGPFAIRLPNVYREVLTGIVPVWLDRAYSDLRTRYGKLTPQTLFVELYADQDSFGVRTSGVPATFLQGVCFGRTVVARLPTDEPTNLGMTLWHELSHVYHLQLSKHRVPRWFTEGLAEVETARHRPEWSREQDLAVYRALVGGQLPRVKQLNRAFSHAATLDDLAVAYVASTYLVEHIARRYGYDRITKMLKAWGEHQSTERVVSDVLATNLDDLDAAFRESLRQRFAHFENQYLPPDHQRSVEAARAELAKRPSDPTARAELAHAELLQGRLAAAREIIAQTAPDQANHPDLLWISSILALADQKPAPAEAHLRKMLSAGKDGYFVRMQLALARRMQADAAGERAELQRAHAYHGTASEPLYRMAAMANQAGDRKNELSAMASLAQLEESDVNVHRRLVELYIELGQPKDARAAAEALGYVNPLDADVHRLLARVALANRDGISARRELGYARRLAAPGAEREKIDQAITDLTAGRLSNLAISNGTLR